MAVPGTSPVPPSLALGKSSLPPANLGSPRPSSRLARPTRRESQPQTHMSGAVPPDAGKTCRKRPPGSRPRKPRRSSAEVHAELMKAQADTDWLEDNVCTVCTAPVRGRELYCSPACRLGDCGKVSPYPSGLAPTLSRLSVSRRTSVSPSARSSGSNASTDMARISSQTDPETDLASPAPPSPSGAESQPAPLGLPAPYVSDMAARPQFGSPAMRYNRRPSKAPMPPPVMLDSPASPTFIPQRHRHSFAMGMSMSEQTPRAEPRMAEGEAAGENTDPGSSTLHPARSYAAPMAPIAQPIRRTSLAAAPYATANRAGYKADPPAFAPSFNSWTMPFLQPASPHRTAWRTGHAGERPARRSLSRPTAPAPLPALSPLSSPTNCRGL